MIDIWYLNISNISKSEFNELLQTLPPAMVQDVMRFRFFKDRCFKLFGKLIVQKFHLDRDLHFDWSKWQLSANGKPYYEVGKKFNISHSGDYVLAAFSDEEIGVDIEQLGEIDTAAIADFLHPLETKFIEEATDSQDAFYKVWTRKEAYLKARGIGIVQGLNRENCLEPYVDHEETWFLTCLNFLPKYKLALCTQTPNSSVAKLKLESSKFLIL